jgi:hypothetical protein
MRGNLIREFKGESTDLDDVAIGEDAFALWLPVDDNFCTAPQIADVARVLILNDQGMVTADARGDEVKVTMLFGADEDDRLAQFQRCFARIFALGNKLGFG